MQYRLGAYRGVWCIVWRDAGAGTKRRSLGLAASQENRPAAEAAVAEFAAARRKESTRPSGIVTIEKILDAYHAARPKQPKRQALYIHFGNWTPAAIDLIACEQYIEKRRSQGIAAATIHSEMATLRSAMIRAQHSKWIEDAPAVVKPDRGPPRDRWLTPEEAQKLLDNAGSHHVRLFIMLALYTGARKSAILGLTWDRVSFDMERIDFTDPKERAGRKRRAIVPIEPGLLAELREAHAGRTTEFVVEWAGGPIKNVKRGFAEACRRAQLVGVTPHTLRHTAASWAAQAGAPMWEIAGMLGHTTTEITQRVYAKHHPDFLRNASSAIELRLHSARSVQLNPKTGTNGEKKRK
jgi:integrase